MAKKRHRGAAARQNHDLTAHIGSLGLASISEYQTWCRTHGFPASLNKTWDLRRQERAFAEELAEKRDVEREVMAYIGELGLESVEAYQAWCASRGFSTGLQKSDSQRRREVEFLQRERADAAFQKATKEQRNPSRVIRQIADHRIRQKDLHGDELRRIHDLFQRVAGEERSAFTRMLLRVEKRADKLLSLDAVYPQYGQSPANRMIDGLFALASQHQRWIRQPESWKPERYNTRRQFGSLARHLLAAYDVPPCLDSVWFLPEYGDVGRARSWWFHIVDGGNIRRADLPLQFTKRMAHLFQFAPDDLTAHQSLRWAQIVGMGGSEHLAEAVLATPLGGSFENEEFWESVVKFFVYNPMLDLNAVAPMVDYITHQKYTPEQVEDPNGAMLDGDPPNPGFSMRGRTVDSLLRQVDEWLGELAKEKKAGDVALRRVVREIVSGRRHVGLVGRVSGQRGLVAAAGVDGRRQERHEGRLASAGQAQRRPHQVERQRRAAGTPVHRVRPDETVGGEAADSCAPPRLISPRMGSLGKGGV
ncbi:MAG: hypothetical protein O3A46_08970 [Candidatus Poribacteria bacterium]|nr:hypothetical protein [Candidatus Poribacteria bacterium]